MATKKSRRFALIVLLIVATTAELVQPAQAHSGNSGSPALNSWLRRVSTASADGSWLWGWAWGADNTVTVVDRSPPLNFVSRPASFGRMIEDAVMGYGIPMNAFTVTCDEGTELSIDANLGCPRLCPSGPHIPKPEEAWIAIVQRGKCPFVEKVREAQRFGAKAVVVGGDDPAVSRNPDVLVNMYSQGDASDVKIPSTYIKYSDYAHLSNLIASSNTSTSGIRTVSLQITSDYASWEWYSPILTFIVLLLLPSVLTLTTLLIHRVRTARAEQRERAPEDVVNRLPWRVWTGTGWEKHEGPVPARAGSTKSRSDTEIDLDLDLERGAVDVELEQEIQHPSTSHDDADAESVNPPWFDAQTECAICLTDFAKGDRVRVLPCKHIFHLDEVDEWLIHRRKLCPVCKADVTQPLNPYAHLEPHGPTSLASEHAPEPELELVASDVASERTPLLSQQHFHTSTSRSRSRSRSRSSSPSSPPHSPSQRDHSQQTEQ